MTPPRVDEITEPLVEGRTYLVPVLTAVWMERAGEWPLLGPPHNDSDLTLIDAAHWHIDPRFLPADFALPAGAWNVEPLYTEAPRIAADCHPWLASVGQPRRDAGLLPAILKPRTCHRAHVDFALPWRSLNTGFHDHVRAKFRGQQCQRSKGGWICPHKGTPLGSIMPVGGVITCPQHGLRIDAATGRCLM